MEIGNRDLDKLDPDWRFAYFHAKATRPGICTDDRPELCQCCLNIIHKNAVDVGVHAKELEFLGFAFPLWFSFLKYCIILTIILIVSEASVSLFQAVHMNKEFCLTEYNQLNNWIGHTDLPTTTNSHGDLMGHHEHQTSLVRKYSHNSQHPSEETVQKTSQQVRLDSPKGSKKHKAIGDSLLQKQPSNGQHQYLGEQGHDPSHHHCTSIFILLSRIDAEIDELQAMLRISTFIIIMFTLLFIRDTIYKTEQYYDERMCSLSDYSILVSNLPQTDGVQAKIRNFFKEGLSEPFNVEELILMPGMDELEEAQHEKNHHIKQLQKFYKSRKLNHEHEIAKIENQIEDIEEREENAIEGFKHELRNDKLQAEKAIIVFSSEPAKEKFMYEFENLKQQDPGKLVEFFGMQGADIEVSQAPEPREIIWENINYPTSKRFGRVLLGWSLSILFIAVITGLFYLILKWKTHVAEEVSLKWATIIVFAALILVIIFNKFLMGHVLHYFTHLEKHATADNEQFSFAFKYALGMFFTTALMTLLVEAVTYGNFYTHHFGVIEEESIMFLMNSLLVPIIWAINPFQIWVLIRRKMNFGRKDLTQREANHIMEDFHYDVGKRYAQVLQSMWFTFLYAPLIPFGAFLTAIGIGLYYWVDKYNLLRRSSIKQNVSGKLSITALTLLDLVLVFFPLGQIIFDHYLRHHVNLSSIVQLIIALIYICLPLNSIIDFFNKENFYLQEKLYRDVKETFKDNYMHLHPLYSKLSPEQNSESRRLYKETIIKQFANPVFSFVTGWLGNKNHHNSLFGRHLSSKMKTTCDGSPRAESSLRPDSFLFEK